MLNNQYDRTKTPSKTQTKGYESVIGDGLIINGGLTSTNNVRIDGEVHGNISSEGSVLVGETGTVIGHIIAEEIILAGSVEGHLHGTSVSLQALAKLKGDINCTGNNISVSAGAEIDGSIKMNQPFRSGELLGTDSTKPETVTPDNTTFSNGDEQ